MFPRLPGTGTARTGRRHPITASAASFGQHRTMPVAAAPPFRTLRAETDGRLGRLTLDQPDRLNPIGALALEELAAAAAWFDEQGAALVVVGGAGRAFCAGFDLRELTAAPSGRGPADHPGGSTPALGAAMAAAVSSMEALTVAAVQGPCVGGGFVLALCCDLRIAADDAWFSLPEAELGIPLAWSGVPRLVRELGAARAAELILTCRRMPAVEAHAAGLVNEVVERGSLDAVVAERTGLILERSDAVIRTTKRQVREAAEALVPTSGDWAGTDELIAALRTLIGG